jgi:multiple sugar transport system ATP-binding protein
VTTRNGRVHVHAPGLEASLWEGSVEDRSVLLGVRPEHLQASAHPGEADVTIAAEVMAVENLGNEEIAVCALGETRVSIRRPRPIGVGVGDRVTLVAAARNAALFDAGTGRRLHWRGETPEPVERVPTTLATTI